jgi:hypothetical protein
MIRDISVGIKSILEFSPALYVDDWMIHFFGACTHFQGAENTRIPRIGQRDPRFDSIHPPQSLCYGGWIEFTNGIKK